MDIKKLELLFKESKIDELSQSELGKKFLKLRSLNRSRYLQDLLIMCNLDTSIKSKEQLPTLLNHTISIHEIDDFIRKKYAEEREYRRNRENLLYNELHKLKYFDWGGLHQNNLEKTIVDNYIKKIDSYEQIENKIETELQNSLRGYVLCSWYNHWSSIIIEDIFKDHDRILPALGLIPKIDFFVDDIPFDLKVTYLPEGFIKQKRKEYKQKTELSILKTIAKELNICIDTTLSETQSLENLWNKIKEHKPSHNLFQELIQFRLNIVKEIEHDPNELIVWLYENQGVRRFDGSNRLFIILVNQDNFFEGWKLKRSFSLIRELIKKYLDQNKEVGRSITFKWDNLPYTTIADVLIIKNQ